MLLESISSPADLRGLSFKQLDDLSRSAQTLADDLFAGRKRHQTYRQLKMYNDPALNPYLYQAADAAR